ncbi:MAG: uroporphyrinogen decarboxylase family protein [Candidatus Omnitrophota bacterium]
MTSKERVLAAIAHRATDRVPLDFWAEEVVWRRLMRELGLSSKSALLSRLNIDLRWIDHRYIGPDFSHPRGETIENMWGERFRIMPNGDRVACGGALDRVQTFEEIARHHWPSNDWVSYSHLRESARRDGEYAMVYGYADIWQRAAMIRGLDNMFFDMLERPEWVDYMTGKLMDFYIEDWTRAMEETEGRIDLFFLISDLGTQRGPMISLDLFRRFIKPRIQRMAELAHGFGKKLLFHSCGAVRSFIEEMIEAGVDALNPMQTGCAGMNPKELKTDFGARLCFHGGMDIQRALPFGTPEEVRTETKKMLEAMKGDGGFILAPSHTLLPDIPTENILAMYDCAVQ